MTSLHRDPKLRASDADRDHVAEALREHCATGRLTVEEFGERLDRCYAAQTYGDLEALVEDLPAANQYGDLPVPVSADQLALTPVHPHAAREDGYGAWAAWGSASVICWAVWLATVISGGGLSGVWPVWVTVPWGGVLLAQELGGHGQHGPDLPVPHRPALPAPPRPPGLPGHPGDPRKRRPSS